MISLPNKPLQTLCEPSDDVWNRSSRNKIRYAHWTVYTVDKRIAVGGSVLRRTVHVEGEGRRGQSEGCMTTCIATSYKVMPRLHRDCYFRLRFTTPFYPSRECNSSLVKPCSPSISSSCHHKARVSSSRMDLPCTFLKSSAKYAVAPSTHPGTRLMGVAHEHTCR